MDRTLSYKTHLETTAAKINTRNNIIHKLCGITWGAEASTLKTSAISLVYSVAEYCAPVCHVKTIDTKLNETIGTISGCSKSTPLPWLPVLSNTAPHTIRRQESLVYEYNKIVLSLYSQRTMNDLPDACLMRLKSRSPHYLWQHNSAERTFI
ncbi:hypothetical protein HUJ05_007781 [Dendroctonus ponderosae]|nr:hypothetical protein HUJ05_007781 [Dendroctonus ponderosae]